MRPLLFLVADKNMEFALRGFFERAEWHRSVGCAPLDFDTKTDIQVASGQNDPGIHSAGNVLLRPFSGKYAHVVVMIDEQWEGSPGAQAIRDQVAQHITDAGWPPDAGLPLVLVPEVDTWLWSDSPHTPTALGWSSWQDLRPALCDAGWLTPGEHKPSQPKEAAEWALRNAPKRWPRSSRIYAQVTSKVSAILNSPAWLKHIQNRRGNRRRR